MRQLSSFVGLVSTGALAALSTACGPAPVAPIDAQFPDAAVPDAVIVHPIDDRADPCDAPMRVMGTLGTPSDVTFDTSMLDTRPRDLGLACGNVGARVWAPQQVIEYVVPGTGPMGVTISTANTGTATRFNTVIQVRQSCLMPPASPFPPSCFDDAGTEVRAVGGAQAMGGDTLFIYVTGYSEPEAVTMQVDEGPVHLTISAAPNQPPTLSSGQLRLINTDSRIEAAGMDPDGNILGVTLGLRNAAGRLDFNGDGAGDERDVFDFRFGEVTGTTDWTGRVDISGMMYRFAEVCRDPMVNCTGAILVAYDSAFATSAPLTVPVADAMIVGIGETCDDEHACAPSLVCNAMMVCEPTPAVLSACGAAQAIAVDPPMGTATSGSAMATLPGGASGTFTAPAGCTPDATATDGPERVFRIAVPAGTFDLTVRTDRPGTGATDTVLYLRSACGDPTASLGCQDDINTMGMMYGSTVTAMNVTEGDYFAFVETYGGMGGAVEVQATLRPVLATGEACDPAGVMNRCMGGACPAATMMCP